PSCPIGTPAQNSTIAPPRSPPSHSLPHPRRTNSPHSRVCLKFDLRAASLRVAEGDLTPSYRIAERSGLCYVRPVETAPPLRPRGWRSRATRGPATISMPCRAASSAQTGPWGVGHLLGKAEGFLARGENIAGVAE